MLLFYLQYGTLKFYNNMKGVRIMTKKKSPVAELGFIKDEAYPANFYQDDKGRKVEYKPYFGAHTLPFNKESERVIKLNDGTCTIIKGKVPMSGMIQSNLIPNSVNPRDAVYTLNRHEIVETAMFAPVFFEFSFGCTVVASEMKYDHKKIKFVVPEDEIETETGKRNKYGILNGQNLALISTTVVEAINRGDFEPNYDIDECFIPFEFYVFSKGVSNENIMRVCKIKNFTVSQNPMALAAMSGAFEKYIFPSIEHGVEVKDGEAKTDIEYRNICNAIMSGKYDNVEEDMSLCVGSRVDKDSYFKYISMIYFAAQRLEYFKNETERLKAWKKMSGYDKNDVSNERKDIRKKSVEKTMTYGRHKMYAIRDVLNANNSKTHVIFEPALNDELVRKFFFEAFDVVCSTDYTHFMDKKPAIASALGLKQYKDNVLSPFARNVMPYKFPVGLITFIPFLFGSFCDIVTDEFECETVVCNVDFKAFWEDNYDKILTHIGKYRMTDEAKADTYCLFNPNSNGCINLWNQLRDECLRVKPKYIISK